MNSVACHLPLNIGSPHRPHGSFCSFFPNTQCKWLHSPGSTICPVGPRTKTGPYACEQGKRTKRSASRPARSDANTRSSSSIYPLTEDTKNPSNGRNWALRKWAKYCCPSPSSGSPSHKEAQRAPDQGAVLRAWRGVGTRPAAAARSGPYRRAVGSDVCESHTSVRLSSTTRSVSFFLYPQTLALRYLAGRGLVNIWKRINKLF